MKTTYNITSTTYKSNTTSAQKQQSFPRQEPPKDSPEASDEKGALVKLTSHSSFT